jgi:hypothetical protein
MVGKICIGNFFPVCTFFFLLVPEIVLTFSERIIHELKSMLFNRKFLGSFLFFSLHQTQKLFARIKLKYLNEVKSKKLQKEGFRVTLNTFSIKRENSAQKKLYGTINFRRERSRVSFFHRFAARVKRITFHQSFWRRKKKVRKRKNIAKKINKNIIHAVSRS